jgi:xylan 1,4-beta-xylosidase
MLLTPGSGKNITLTSGADGSLLAVDDQSMSLVNVPADSKTATAQNVQFRVVDLGKGRVALRTGNGRFLSAADDRVSIKELVGIAPEDSESFQWINLMRSDTMLLSLVHHRYLTTMPNNPGPVTVSATGPRPDRKDGACFKWRAVE